MEQRDQLVVELIPEGCVVTTGLSKSMALGGWRVGFARFPDNAAGERLRDEVIGIASEVWSSLAQPMQAAAAYVLDEPADVVAHVEASRRLHGRVVSTMAEEFARSGARCRSPRGGFYLYPDVEVWRAGLARQGVATGAALAEHLLERYGVGVLPGEAFGDDPAALRFRVATSLLYGRTDDERWTALRSADPVALPWIADALATLRTTLDALSSL